MKKITLFIFLLITSLGYSQDPAVGATNPIARNSWDVKSLYGEIYTNEPNGNFLDFGGTTIVGPITLGDGNTVMKYTNHLYSGIQAGAGNLDVTTMTKLHIDVYSPSGNFTSFAIKLEAVNGSNVEIQVPFAKAIGSWNSYDLDLSNYSEVDLAHLKYVVPVSYTPPGVTLYLDNVYFYRPATSTPSPTFGPFTIADKSPTDVPFTITPPTSNSTGAFTYTSSNTAVATISGNTVTIVASGTTNIVATQAATASYAQGSASATLTVKAVPTTAAPTPPARPTADVISLYSNAYTNVASNFDAGWCGGSSVQEVMIAGNATMAWKNNACQGIVLNAGVDASTFTRLHVDVYIEAGTVLTSSVFNLKFVQQPGGAALEVNFNAASTPPLVAGSWLSIDVPVNLTTFTGFKEFGITSPNLNNKLWYDNLYIHKGTVLGVTDFKMAKINMYPNPVSNELNLSAENTIQNVSVYNILGQEVLSSNPNTNSAKLQTSNLNKGVYLVKATIDGNVSSSKFIKE